MSDILTVFRVHVLSITSFLQPTIGSQVAMLPGACHTGPAKSAKYSINRSTSSHSGQSHHMPSPVDRSKRQPSVTPSTSRDLPTHHPISQFLFLECIPTTPFQ